MVKLDGLSLPEPVLEEIERYFSLMAHQVCTPRAAVVIGSATRNDLWEKDSSDVDFNIFIDDDLAGDLGKLVLSLTKMNAPKFNWELLPHIICDFQQPRIEAVLKSDQGVKLDLTWSGNLVTIGNTPWSIARDNLELYIGNMYTHSKLISGELPPCEPLERINPYYHEHLRASRLENLSGELLSATKQTANLLRRNDFGSALVSLGYMQKVFLQALFISHRTYPLSYDQHIRTQLESYLGFQDEDIRKLFEWKEISPSSVTDRGALWYNSLNYPSPPAFESKARQPNPDRHP